MKDTVKLFTTVTYQRILAQFNLEQTDIPQLTEGMRKKWEELRGEKDD